MDRCPRCGFAESDYVTTTEALEMLGVSDQTVRNWVKAGRFAGVIQTRFGKRYLIPVAEVERVRAEERGAA